MPAPEIDLTPMNEATARALYAEQTADRFLGAHDIPSNEHPRVRIAMRDAAKADWDAGQVPHKRMVTYRELALAATLTTWKDVARQAWQQGYDTPRDYIIDSTLAGEDPHVIVSHDAPNPYATPVDSSDEG